MKDKLHIKKHKWPYTFPMVTTHHSMLAMFTNAKQPHRFPVCFYSWLGKVGYIYLQVRSKCSLDPHATVFCLFMFFGVFFHKDKKKHTHLPHDMQQFMGYSYIQSQKLAVTGCSNGQHRGQYSRWRHRTTFSGQQTLYHGSHGFHLWTLTFQEM